MGDRFVVIIVSLLTLIVMCGLVVLAVSWLPGRVDELDERLARIEEQKAAIDVMQNDLAHLDEIREKLGEARREGSNAGPLTRIDTRVDELTRKMEVVVGEVNRIKNLPTKSDLDRLTGKINELTAKVAARPKSDPEVRKLAAGLVKMKSEIQAAQKALDKKVIELSRELKRINLQIQKLEVQIKRIPTEGS